MWKLLLSRETFHRFNRVVLLTVLALALVLPWIKVSLGTSSLVTQQMVRREELIVTPSGVIQPSQATQLWNVMNVVTLVYFAGLAIAFAWQLHSQWSLHRLLKKGRIETLPGGIALHVLPSDITPFSYFNHIVISEQDYRDNPKEILTHELAHIGLRHSCDVVFMSVVTLFQWWNPAAWLLCRELRQVHEFEADEAVLQQGIDARQYQLLLIRKSVGNQLFSMANNFNYQSLKKRIRMMTINKSSQWKKLWALAAVPVIALALLAFANPTTDAATVQNNVDQQVAKTSDQGKKVYKSVEQMPQFPGGELALIQYLQSEIKYPPTAAANNIEGRVIVQFVVDENGEIGEVKVLRSVDEEVDAEAVRVIKSLPKFIPGRQDGKAVSVWYTLPVSFKLQGDPEKPSPSEP